MKTQVDKDRFRESVRLMARLYEVRDQAKEIYGNDYEGRVEPYKKAIKKHMRDTGDDNHLSAALDLIKILKAKGELNQVRTVLISSAALDLAEA